MPIELVIARCPGVPISVYGGEDIAATSPAPVLPSDPPFLLIQATSKPSKARSTMRCHTVTHTSQIIHAQSPSRLPSPVFASICSLSAAISVVNFTSASLILFLYFRLRTSRSLDCPATAITASSSSNRPPLISSNSSRSSSSSSPSLTGLNILSPPPPPPPPHLPSRSQRIHRC